jgi:hypothetical protein
LQAKLKLQYSRLNSWADLRTLAPDDIPTVGYDSIVEDLFRLTAQGGISIMIFSAFDLATAYLSRG